MPVGGTVPVWEIAPQHWWLGRTDGPLVIEINRVEPYPDQVGAGWAVVEGWRRLPNGGRRRTRDLVRTAAVPAELLTVAGADVAGGRP
jgi:hypothetical protein